jgi:16S rRNA processing protein RimM
LNAGDSEDYLLIGKVLRPHGLGGMLRIGSYARSGNSFRECGVVYLEMPDGALREYTVQSAKPQRKALLLKLQGLNSVEEAEALRDCGVYARKDTLEREEDEYFWYELIGLEVYLKNGSRIGTLSRILETGSHDIYVIQEENTERFIPAVHEIVEAIDLKNNRMIVNDMEGLLDLNEV